MSVEALRTLAIATVASSVAIWLAVLLRKPLRVMAGARAAYWLWLLVPVLTAASCIPAPEQVIFESRITLPPEFASALPALGRTTIGPTGSRIVISTALGIWLVGACVMFAMLLRKQRAFSRSLGPLTVGPGGLHRSQSAAGPMLLGIWRPIIVVPPDFELRYSEQERQLVLAHELAHFRRHDAVSNAIASGWLCVLWFNPLVYWAIDWLRADQELACDALVIANNVHARRSYANALLKFQLVVDSRRHTPVGCHWQSNHPLKDRITMLQRPLPRISRHLTGIALVVGLTLSGGYATWAAQSAQNGQGAPILVDLKLTVTNSKTHEVFAVSTEYLVHSGELPDGLTGGPAVCTPFLPGETGSDIELEARKTLGVPVPSAGQVLLECTVRDNGAVVATPSLITANGQSTVVEVADLNGPRRYTIEVSASTSQEKIDAVKQAAEARQVAAKR